MNFRILLALGAGFPALLAAQPAERYAGERPPSTVADPPPAVVPPSAEPQRLYAPGATLIAPEKAQQIVELFRDAYGRLGQPRMVFAVNRELVDPGSGLQLSGRKERIEGVRTEVTSDLAPTAEAPAGAAPQTQVNVAVGGSAGTGGAALPFAKGEASSRTEKVTAENTYTADAPAKVALADRQTVRDIERLFGRPLRVAGARVADQRVVAQLIADKPVDHFLAGGNDAARKDREALEKIADVVIEVLISSRALTTTGISDDRTYTVPDIQATAIRLSDGAILGQAASSDVLGKDRYAGPIVRTFDVNDIAEATALALMEDLALTTP